MCNKSVTRLLILLAGLFFTTYGKAQIKINSITIDGNTKTKSYVILRELPYQIGEVLTKDSLASLNKSAEAQLLNLSLFVEIKLTPEFIDSTTVDIHIRVKERWYFFPIPILKLVDRNFNQWWVQQQHDLDRVNYGVNFRQGNTTGNNDKFVLSIISGYSNQLAARYQLPFIDKKLRFGMGIGIQSYSQKELNSMTINDKQVFFRNNEVNRKGFRANYSVTYRPHLFEKQIFQIGLGKEQIADSVLLMVPNFLPNHKASMDYVDFSYLYSYVRFNYNAYPTQGNSNEFSMTQRFSSNSNYTSLQFRKIKAHSFSTKNFLFLESNTIVKFLPNINYSDQKIFGYGNLQMSGLEYYVVEGNAATVFKSSFHHLLGSYSFNNYFNFKIFPQQIKYLFWVKAFTQLGYVYTERPSNVNKLNNTLLRTAGIGVDIIGIYDFVLKLDYSVNQLGDKGLYLRGGINF